MQYFSDSNMYVNSVDAVIKVSNSELVICVSWLFSIFYRAIGTYNLYQYNHFHIVTGWNNFIPFAITGNIPFCITTACDIHTWLPCYWESLTFYHIMHLTFILSFSKQLETMQYLISKCHLNYLVFGSFTRKCSQTTAAFTQFIWY